MFDGFGSGGTKAGIFGNQPVRADQLLRNTKTQCLCAETPQHHIMENLCGWLARESKEFQKWARSATEK